MPDFQTQPATTDTYVNILTYLRDKEVALAKMDYTGWTNIPTGAIRSNSASSYKLQRWNGTAWVDLDFHTTIDAHIANTTIHQAINVGSIEMIAYGTADAGWLLCRGQTFPTATYPALFAKIGYTYGGSGANFQLPNLLGRIPIGVYPSSEAGYTADFANINALNAATGDWNHTHTTPAHSHPVNDHFHTLAAHTHTVGAHAHTVPDHLHGVPGHYHDSRAAGATINIQSSGAHNHTETDCRTSDSGTTPIDSIRLTGRSATASITIDSGGSSHTHPNTSFSGTVGNVNGGFSGDNTFNTYGSGAFSSGNSTAFETGGPSVPNTGTISGLTTTSSGGGTSGGNNPRVLTFNFQIKT